MNRSVVAVSLWLARAIIVRLWSNGVLVEADDAEAGGGRLTLMEGGWWRLVEADGEAIRSGRCICAAGLVRRSVHRHPRARPPDARRLRERRRHRAARLVHLRAAAEQHHQVWPLLPHAQSDARGRRRHPLGPPRLRLPG